VTPVQILFPTMSKGQRIAKKKTLTIKKRMRGRLSFRGGNNHQVGTRARRTETPYEYEQVKGGGGTHI